MSRQRKNSEMKDSNNSLNTSGSSLTDEMFGKAVSHFEFLSEDEQPQKDNSKAAQVASPTLSNITILAR